MKIAKKMIFYEKSDEKMSESSENLENKSIAILLHPQVDAIAAYLFQWELYETLSKYNEEKLSLINLEGKNLIRDNCSNIICSYPQEIIHPTIQLRIACDSCGKMILDKYGLYSISITHCCYACKNEKNLDIRLDQCFDCWAIGQRTFCCSHQEGTLNALKTEFMSHDKEIEKAMQCETFFYLDYEFDMYDPENPTYTLILYKNGVEKKRALKNYAPQRNFIENAFYNIRGEEVKEKAIC